MIDLKRNTSVIDKEIISVQRLILSIPYDDTGINLSDFRVLRIVTAL